MAKTTSPQPPLRLNPVHSLTTTAMAIAIGTVLAIMSKQLFGNLPLRVDFSAWAVLLVSLLFGFPHGAVAYMLIDILSSIFFYPPFLPITLCKLVTGLAFDLFLPKVRRYPAKCLLLFLVNGIVIDCIAMAHALYFLQGGSISALLLLRVGSAVTNICMFLFFVYVLYPKLEAPLHHLFRRKTNG